MWPGAIYVTALPSSARACHSTVCGGHSWSMHHRYLPSAHGEKGVGGGSEVHASCSLILQDGMSARITKDRLRQTCG